VNVNRRFLFVPSVVAVLYLCNLPNGLASVGGTIGDVTGTAGTLYTNLTPHAMNFELSLTSFGGSTSSASWTDEGGKSTNGYRGSAAIHRCFLLAPRQRCHYVELLNQLPA
jgi:hypothetical protein